MFAISVALCVTLAAVPRAPGETDAAKNLVAAWPLGDTSWKDASGGGHDLVAKGKAGLPQIVAVGKNMNAVRLEPAKGRYLVATGDSSDFAVGTGNFTLTAWVKSARPLLRSSVLGLQASDYGSSNYGFYQRQGAYQFVLNGPNKGEAWPIIIKRPVRSDWCHLAGVRNGDKLLFYIDGKLRASRDGVGAINPDSSGKAFAIGAGNRLGEPFDGQIAQVKLYKSALTADMVAAEYDGIKDSFGTRNREIVLYDQGFESLPVGETTIAGLRGSPDMPDIAVSDEAHYTSARSLRIVYHPERRITHALRLSPAFHTSANCTLTVSLRVKFEDVIDPNHRKSLYPYIRVQTYDDRGKMEGSHSLLYSRTTTDTETSVDYNWIVVTEEITPAQGARSFDLVMFMYEKEGVMGTVYVDDIRIVQRFND